MDTNFLIEDAHSLRDKKDISVLRKYLLILSSIYNIILPNFKIMSSLKTQYRKRYMDARKWGPYAWYKFHKKAIKYPMNPNIVDMENAEKFYYSDFLKYIKCDSCINDYLMIISYYPIRLDSKYSLFNWTVDVHNIVNNKLGKRIINYSEAYNIWKPTFPNKCNHCICKHKIPYLYPNIFDQDAFCKGVFYQQ